MTSEGEEVLCDVTDVQGGGEDARDEADGSIGRLVKSAFAPLLPHAKTQMEPSPTTEPSKVTTRHTEVQRQSEDTSKHCYPMNHRNRGDLIIINNKNFHASTGQRTRNGTEVDEKNLVADFTRLGFNVVVHNDQTSMQMLRIMIAASRKDYSDSDCFGVAVLSHGDESVLYGVDGEIHVENFIAPIKDCNSLNGKPKIFIFQACRGTRLDAGGEVCDGGPSSSPETKRIFIEADYLYAYSTVPGYYAFRNCAKGSWFIQALHSILQEHSFSMDFMTLLTHVNRKVAYEFESHSDNSWCDKKKSIPSIVTMFTKDLYFTEKKAT